MKCNVFLASSLQTVAKDLTKHLDKSVKKFLFITTASEVEKGDKKWLKFDRNSMTDLGYDLEDYTITGESSNEIAKKLKKVDGIVMAGGNTFFLLQQMQLSKSLKLFARFVKNGGIYIGSSAGSIVAGPDIWPVRRFDVLSKAKKIKGYKGIGLTDIVIFPHWGSDYFKDGHLRKRMADNYNLDHKIILLNDNQYLIVNDKNLQFIDVKKDK